MKKKLKFFWVLFKSCFYLSTFTFGGGYVIVPLMKRKFADELNWIEEKEMIDIIAIAQSSPGAMAVNASILIGYRVSGLLGALVTVLGTVLPPMVILSVISLFYTSFKNNVVINALLKGMQAGVAAVILDVVIGMGRGILEDKKILYVLIMVVAFICTYFLGVNVVFIVLACGLTGVAVFYLQGDDNRINRKSDAER